MPALFPITPDERPLVLRLTVVYFWLTASIAFVQAVSFSLFVDAYSPAALPYVYGVTAVVASVVATIYLQVARRVSLAALLVGVLSIVIAGTLGLRLLLLTGHPGAAFVLPIWFQLQVNLLYLAFWAFAGRTFDLRQSKRVFGVIGAGNLLSALVAGALVVPLVRVLGTDNLLLVAAGCVGIGFALLVPLLRRLRTPTAEQPHTRAASSKRPVWRDRYVVYILLLITFWWIGFQIIDNIFFRRAAVHFPSDDDIAAVLGALVALQGVGATIVTFFLTSRLLTRFGIRAGLLIMPLLLVVAMAASLVLQSAAGFTLFLIAAFAKLTSLALGISIDQSSRVILYQPLPAASRVQAQGLADGVVQPLAVGLSSVIILVLTGPLGLGAQGLAAVFLIVAAMWMLIVFLLAAEYPRTIARALENRNLAPAELELDRAAITILRRRLEDPQPEIVIYALRLLQEARVSDYEALLLRLLDHPAPAVRQTALNYLEARAAQAAVPSARALMTADPDPAVRVAALRLMAALTDAEYEPEVVALQHDPDPTIRRGALAVLVQTAPSAKAEVVRLVESPDATERLLAAEVLGDVPAALPTSELHLHTLVGDADLRVRRAALRASVRYPSLYLQLVRALAQTDVRVAAVSALMAGGAPMIPLLSSAYDPAPQRVQLRILYIVSRIGGDQGEHFLRRAFDSAVSVEVRHAALEALLRLEARLDRSFIEPLLGREAVFAATMLLALTALGRAPALLRDALRQQIDYARRNLLVMLALATDHTAVMQARDILLPTHTQPTPEERVAALEIVDAFLPAAARDTVLPILDSERTLDPADVLRRWRAPLPVPADDAVGWLRALISQPLGHTAWTAACAIYAAGSAGALRDALRTAVQTASDPLIRQVAARTLEPERTHTMLSTIERVLILKSVRLFADTPDDVLATLASVVDETHVSAGDVVFRKGDPGSSMYIIVSGRVRVHDEDRTLNELGDRAFFGELSLLDPEPRSASITALADTHLFRIDDTPFYDLIGDRVEVARALMRALAGYVRSQVSEAARLYSRVRDLETQPPIP